MKEVPIEELDQVSTSKKALKGDSLFDLFLIVFSMSEGVGIITFHFFINYGFGVMKEVPVEDGEKLRLKIVLRSHSFIDLRCAAACKSLKRLRSCTHDIDCTIVSGLAFTMDLFLSTNEISLAQ